MGAELLASERIPWNPIARTCTTNHWLGEEIQHAICKPEITGKVNGFCTGGTFDLKGSAAEKESFRFAFNCIINIRVQNILINAVLAVQAIVKSNTMRFHVMLVPECRSKSNHFIFEVETFNPEVITIYLFELNEIISRRTNQFYRSFTNNIII